MKLWLVGLLLGHGSLIYPGPKEVEFVSRVVSYTFCPTCKVCSGVMLDGENILTVAHCFNEEYKRSNRNYALRISNQHVHKNYLLSTYSYIFYIHPSYDKKDHSHDLMIINFKTVEKAVFPESPLGEIAPEQEERLKRSILWGESFIAEGFSGREGRSWEKRSVPLEFLARAPSPSANIAFIYPPGSEQIVGKGGSGGPIYIERNGKRELVGIVNSINDSETVIFATWLRPLLTWNKLRPFFE